MQSKSGKEVKILAQNFARGDRPSWSQDLATMIRTTEDAVTVFRQIPLQLIELLGFDDEEGFYLDKDGEGWYAICSFWEICKFWDTGDEEFLEKAHAIAGDYGAAIDSMENYLSSLPLDQTPNQIWICWSAFQKALLIRESNVRNKDT